MVVVTERIHCHVPVHGGFSKYCSFLSALFALGNMVHYSFTSCISQLFLGVWVLHVDYGTMDFSGDEFVRGAMLGLTADMGLHTFSTSTWARILAFFLLVSRRMEKYAQSMLRFESLHALFALGVRTTFPRDDCWNLRDDEGYFSRSVRFFFSASSSELRPVVTGS